MKKIYSEVRTWATRIGIFIALFLLLAAPIFAHNEDNNGSITVCKMIVDNNGTIATSTQSLPSGSFSIIVSQGATATSSTFLQTVSFDAATFSPNKKIILNQNQKDAECVTISNLSPNGSYFYSEETITGSNWTSKKYNDQVSITVDSLDDFFAYSPELWNANPLDDPARNINADGHIVLTNSRPNRTVIILNTYEVPQPQPQALKIIASKIVCDEETDLPNWSGANMDIASGTASDFLATHPNCHLESGWKFQWGYSEVSDPGSAFVGEAANGWTTFGPTNGLGVTNVDIFNLQNSPKIWVREVLQSGYIPFTFTPQNAPGSNVSAEMWCHKDVLNYDNFDFINNPELGETYYCVALNALETPAQFPVCSDGLDNDGDTRIDSLDAACHTDGNPNNLNTYDPNRNNENSKPVITLLGANPFEMILNQTFSNPGATAQDEEDGDITADIVSGGTVTTSIVGSYTVTYNVIDSGGLSAVEVTRAVNVNLPANPGIINICKIIVDQNNTIATSSSNLPSGTFNIKIASTTDFATSTIQTISWGSTAFTPNRNIILNNDDAECITLSNLSLGSYYYSEEIILGSNAWATTTKYNDQDSLSVNNIFDFFVYDNALFTATTTDDALRNVSSDGQVTLSSGNMERTLVVLNKYDTTLLSQCSDNIDNDLDSKIDALDPACHTDGNAINSASYDPNLNSENSKPVITLIGSSSITINVGTTYTDEGATAQDEEDGDITSNIVKTGNVDTTAPSTNIITYNVTDSQGLAADQVTRTVIVVNPGGQGGGGGPSTDSGSSGGGGGSGGNGPILTLNSPSVPDAISGGSCYYLYDFLKQGENNNPVEVRKLQVFLKELEGFSTLEVNGIFDDATFAAVSAFQEKYKEDILTPWGHDAATGYVYILTKKKVNENYCKTAFPVTTPEQSEIDSFKVFLTSLQEAEVVSGEEDTSFFENVIQREVGVVPNDISGIVENSRTISPVRSNKLFGLQTGDFLSNLASAAFSLPANIPDAFISLFTFLLALVVIYIAGTLIANSQSSLNKTPYQLKSRKAMYFAVGVLLALLGAYFLHVYFLILPLIIAFVTLVILWFWYSSRKVTSIMAIQTIEKMKKETAAKMTITTPASQTKEENKQVPIIILPGKTEISNTTQNQGSSSVLKSDKDK